MAKVKAHDGSIGHTEQIFSGLFNEMERVARGVAERERESKGIPGVKGRDRNIGRRFDSAYIDNRSALRARVWLEAGVDELIILGSELDKINQQIALAVLKGMSNSHIADQLGCVYDENFVEEHIKVIKKTLGIS